MKFFTLPSDITKDINGWEIYEAYVLALQDHQGMLISVGKARGISRRREMSKFPAGAGAKSQILPWTRGPGRRPRTPKK